MKPVYEREVWVTRFAARLREEQPGIDQSIAIDTAQMLHDKLGMLPPSGAVTVFLEIQLSAYLKAAERAADVLREMRNDPGQLRD